jgi:tagatose 1,6-diphosphate aldolase
VSRDHATARVAPLTDESGLVLGLAFDHRDSLDVLLHELKRSLMPDEIRRLKRDVVTEVAPLATTVMLDHDYGRLAIATRAVRGNAALMMPLEAQGYAQLGDERSTTLLRDFSPRDARDCGAVACKLLLPLRPDRPWFVAAQLGVARAAADATREAGLAFVIEPMVYRLSTESEAEFGNVYPNLVIAATRLAASVGADLLKLPFPIVAGVVDDRGSDASTNLHAAASGTPWVLYGAGASEDVFGRQLRLAMRAGASGFLVGRTVWRDALTAADVLAVARDVCRPRFERFVAIARAPGID